MSRKSIREGQWEDEENRPLAPASSLAEETPEVEELADVELEGEIEQIPAPPTQVSLQYLLPSNIYIVEGPVSGARYVFYGTGAVQMVAEEDAPGLLGKRKTEGCCGSPVVEKPIFRLIQ